MRPPNTRPLSSLVPLPVTISTTRRFSADDWAMNALTARSAATSVMPCRSSLASGRRLPLESARSTSRSNDCGAGAGTLVLAGRVACGRASTRKLSRAGRDSATFGFGAAACLRTGFFRPFSGFTSAIAARNKSTSLAIRLI